MLTPDHIAVMARLGLWFAFPSAFFALFLLVGWSVVWWYDYHTQREAQAHRRELLVRLQELEWACAHEFPVVADTAVYLRRLVYREYEQGVVEFRASLRQKLRWRCVARA
jgi:hypothetical protein